MEVDLDGHVMDQLVSAPNPITIPTMTLSLILTHTLTLTLTLTLNAGMKITPRAMALIAVLVGGVGLAVTRHAHSLITLDQGNRRTLTSRDIQTGG